MDLSSSESLITVGLKDKVYIFSMMAHTMKDTLKITQQLAIREFFIAKSIPILGHLKTIILKEMEKK